MKSLKKIPVATACAAAVMCAATFAACWPDEREDTGSDSFNYTIAMPDGAPALAAAQLMVEDMQFGGTVNYSVVNANAIVQQVSSEKADVCILPVNAAAQVAGSGEKYSLLGTVTHGNLYIISAKHPEEQITVQNLQNLKGKTVGCIQLTSFVGAVFRMILSENNIPYGIIETAEDATGDKVNLINIADPASGITPSTPYDYMIAAEPVVTTKINATKDTAAPIKLVGDIQQLYGEDGFPQAVMLAKNSVIEKDPEFIADVAKAVEESAEWIASDGVVTEDIVAAINANYGGATSSLNAKNLNSTVISRCAIEYVPAAECKQQVTDFIDKFEKVTETSIEIDDKFFYIAK